jgi:hypothetical protein
MAKKTGQLLYLVQTVHWESEFDAAEWAPRTDRFYCPDPDGGAPIKAFLDRITADAYCQSCETAARGPKNPYMRHPNPFCFGDKLPEQTSLPEGVFRDWLLDAGLQPPRRGRNWKGWWDEEHEAMTDEQRRKVWEALDKVRFYRVVEF